MTFAWVAFLIIFLLCTGVLKFGWGLGYEGNADGALGLGLCILFIWLVSGIGLAATTILKLSC